MRFAVYTRATPELPYRRIQWVWARYVDAWAFATAIVTTQPNYGVRIVEEIVL